jgi:hypothetical protein
MTRHCIMPHASGCSEGTMILMGGGPHMLLFKGGRRLLTKVQTTLKNNNTFSNVIVRFCEIFGVARNKKKNRRHYFLLLVHKKFYPTFLYHS